MSKYERQRQQYIDSLKSRSPQSKLLNSSVENKGEWTGTLHPCGDLTIGFKPRYAPNKKEKLEAKARRLEQTMKDSYIHPNTKVEHEIPADPQELESEQLRVLSSSALCNSTKPKKTYGTKGITSKGVKRVKSGAAILERIYGCKQLAFVTTTVPSVSDRDSVLIGVNWGRIVNAFLKRIRRRFERHDTVFECVYASELQLKRGARTGGVFPHLHLVWRCRNDNGDWNVTADQLRHDWRKALELVLTDDVSEWGATCNIQVVKKSAANYLSKYMSKGGINIGRDLTAEEEKQLPRQWWGMTKELWKKVKAETIKLDDETARSVLDNSEMLKSQGILKYYKEITAVIGDNYTVLRGVAAGVAYQFCSDLRGVVDYFRMISVPE